MWTVFLLNASATTLALSGIEAQNRSLSNTPSNAFASYSAPSNQISTLKSYDR